MLSSSPKYVAGHQGMVGSAIVRALRAAGHDNILTCTHRELDLTDQSAVRDFFETTRPGQVYLAAARVGGIQANSLFPAEFIYHNLANQPMTEDSLLTVPIKPTKEPYVIAKIASIKLCKNYNRQYGNRYGTDYRSVMPTFVFRRIAHRPELVKIIDNIDWLFFDKILRRGMGLFVGVWVARYLAPKQFGLLYFATVPIVMFGAVATL